MLNQCNFIGRLGAEPESRHLGGEQVCNFSIGCNETWKDKSGQKQERTEWVRCEAWRRLGEVCQEFLHKGALVFVSGKMKTRAWQDKEGVKRYSTEIAISEMRMLSRAGADHQAGGGYGGGAADVDGGGDIPF